MITIRRATITDAAGIGRVQLDSWRSAYVDWLPDEYLVQFTYTEQTEDWQQLLAKRAVVFVAHDPEQGIVGFAYLREEADAPHPGELVSFHMAPAFRNQGIGRQMWDAVNGYFREQGLPSFWLWVIKDNIPARRFYERLGGTLEGEQTAEFGKGEVVLALPEVAYSYQVT